MFMLIFVLISLSSAANAGSNYDCGADPNAEVKECAIPLECQVSCDKREPGICTKQCDVNSCECKEGYIREEPSGKCIDTNDCPGSDYDCNGDPNAEVKDCAIPLECQVSCDKREPGICTKQCDVNSCECKEGYIREELSGKCIDTNDCPDPRCPYDQTYIDCLDDYCEPTTCDLVGFTINCKGPDDPPSAACEGGCVCKDYKVKDNNGICVDRSACPSCGGDYNATSGCGVHCGNLCSNYKDKANISCILICYLNGCDCKEGYVFNDIIERCIKPDDCPIPCKGDPYAVPTNCINNNRPTCPNPGNKPCEDCCETGCKCADGYVLDRPNGECIKTKYCPNDLGCDGDPNAIITDCESLCPRTCEPNDIICPTVCIPNSCTCKEGYILSKTTGNCIPENECIYSKYESTRPSTPSPPEYY